MKRLALLMLTLAASHVQSAPEPGGWSAYGGDPGGYSVFCADANQCR